MWFDNITFEDYKAHFGASATIEEFNDYVASFRALPSPSVSNSEVKKRRLPPSTEFTWSYSQRAAVHMLRNPEKAIRFFDGKFYLEVVKKNRRYYLSVSPEDSIQGVNPVFIDSDGYKYYFGVSDYLKIVALFRNYVGVYLGVYNEL